MQSPAELLVLLYGKEPEGAVPHPFQPHFLVLASDPGSFESGVVCYTFYRESPIHQQCRVGVGSVRDAFFRLVKDIHVVRIARRIWSGIDYGAPREITARPAMVRQHTQDVALELGQGHGLLTSAPPAAFLPILRGVADRGSTFHAAD